MSATLQRVAELVAHGEVRVSDQGYDELPADGLFTRDLIAGIAGAKVVEAYPAFPKGPCVLVLERDAEGQPVHVVWRIPKGRSGPAVLITAYRPDPTRWSADSVTRKKQ